jgi:UDP-GlcNAc3NAcA epimerase
MGRTREKINKRLQEFNKVKLLSILGARPQFIKAAALSRALKEYPAIEHIIVHTGQHYDINMSQVFFEEMQIPKSDYYLGINGKSHAEMTGMMMIELERVVQKEKPDFVLVYGDTNSTLAGALVASKLHIPLAHIEAGLRSFNLCMPEEINRILTDRVSDILFIPTEKAEKNLQQEGFPFPVCANEKQEIFQVGDIMYDCILYYKNFSRKPQIEVLKRIKENHFFLATVHRAENTDSKERLMSIFAALEKLSVIKPVVLPLHPRTQKKIKEYGIKITDIILIPPVGYLEMLWLIENSSLILTDSGGLQKEAYFLRKNAVVLREETEWVELVEYGYNVLAGFQTENIIKGIEYNFEKSFKDDFFGEGKTAFKIIDVLKSKI